MLIDELKEKLPSFCSEENNYMEIEHFHYDGKAIRIIYVTDDKETLDSYIKEFVKRPEYLTIAKFKK